MDETAEAICLHAQRDRSVSSTPYVHTSVNGQVICVAEHNEKLKGFLKSADVVSCDSQPMALFSKFCCPRSVKERVATTDLIHIVARQAEVRGISFFLLGGTEIENSKAARKLSELYPSLKISGRHHGYLTAENEKIVCNRISELSPDILWVAMGVPLEQDFIERHACDLGTIGVIKTCGGCFKILSGELARPWKVFRILGLEWFARMFLEPRHVILRYAISTPVAIWLAITRMHRT
jgi:exopolysaccharide biosynthesis WecB/TagA/CpsF family protein